MVLLLVKVENRIQYLVCSVDDFYQAQVRFGKCAVCDHCIAEPVQQESER